MPEKYFTKFPLLSYANTTCRDLTKRVTINAEVRTNTDLYYPVEIGAGFRADELAEAYYEDEEMDWMVYLMNKIVDPYYEWYISEINFNDFIIEKYGSFEAAQEKIVYYRNNWYEDNVDITPQAYEQTIDLAWKKYYEPLFTPTNKVYSYRRKREDWVVNTNRIIRYNISQYISNTYFQPDEIIDIYVNGEIVGGGTCVQANSSSLTIQSVSGNTNANNIINDLGVFILGTQNEEIINTEDSNTLITNDPFRGIVDGILMIGETSGANAIANSSVVLAENFGNSESKFWSPVTAYDIELEKWESRKNLDVINSDLILGISDQVTEKLQET